MRTLVAAVVVLVGATSCDDGNKREELGEAQQEVICAFGNPPSVDWSGGGIGGAGGGGVESTYADPAEYGEGECSYWTVEWNNVDWAQVYGPNFGEEQCGVTTLKARFYVKATSISAWTLAHTATEPGQWDGTSCKYGDFYYHTFFNPSGSVYAMRIMGHVEGYDDESSVDLENRRVHFQAFE